MPATSTLYRAAKRAVNALPPWVLRFRPFVVYEIPLATAALTAGNPTSPGQLLGASVRWIENRDEAGSLAPLSSRACVDEFNGTTRRAVVARVDVQRVGCAWIATGAFSETDLGLHFELAPDEAWLYAAAVAPEHRNRGVYRQLLEFVVAELRAAGMRRVLLGVTVGNEPSRRAHARQGAIEVGRIAAVRALGLTRCWVTGHIRRRCGRHGERRVARLSVVP
jgi:ribosomal protein S18 acetylase RimI-like enzyme